MLKILFSKNFRLALLLIFLAELVSISGYYLPFVNKVAFLVIAIAVLILSFYKIEYALLIALVELFIGSKGYLFYFENGGLVISIRIALWLIIMSVWLAKIILKLYKEKKVEIEFLKTNYLKYFIIFSIFLIWGLASAFLNENELSNIFFDFNNWLYLLLIFPFFDVIKSKEKLNGILSVFTASICWLIIKTYFLLFIFSHNLIGAVYDLYRWIRITGIGEITPMPSGFTRIFFQSYIFILVALFLVLVMLIKYLFDNKQIKIKLLLLKPQFLIIFASLTLLISIIILSLSRSFWAGLAGGLIIFSIFLFFRRRELAWQNIFFVFAVFLISTAMSIGIIAAIVKFPYPEPTTQFSTDLLSDRASELTGEAGASSRWSLIGPLFSKIKEAPILGKGFGTTVTYISKDPRVLETNIKGEYSTYAFEWGWLDIWLKIGLLGAISYLLFLGRIIYDSFKNIDFNSDSFLKLPFGLALITIVLVSIFSPYMNHPLGFGAIILTALFAHLHRN